MPKRPAELDSLDRSLVDLLRENARMPIAEITRALGVSRQTASSRLDRLLEDGVLHLLAETDIYSAGRNQFVVLGIRTEGRPVVEVAEELAGFEDVIAVNTVAGRHDIEALVAAETNESLCELLTEQIPLIKGISSRSAGLCIEVMKFESNRVPYLS